MEENKKLTGQLKWNKTWENKNKEYANYLKSRTAARSFIRTKATMEDLEELKGLIENREIDLYVNGEVKE